jgi:IS4 transposase
MGGLADFFAGGSNEQKHQPGLLAEWRRRKWQAHLS